MNEPQAYLLLQQLRETPTAELYPALTDNLSTACNSPLCAPRGISTSQEVVKQSVHFQIQPCLSLVKLCFPPPHKYCPFHLLNHCLEASFPKGVEQSLKWLTQGSGKQNLWPESNFSCGIWYRSTQHFGRRWPLKEHNSKPSTPEFWSGLDCVYPVWPWETGQQSLGLSFVSYTAVTGPTCVVVRSQHVEAPHVYNLFSFTRFVVRERKISCRIDIQSVNWSYWICFSWTPFLPEEFLLDSCGCWLQFLSISFNQKFPVPCGTDPENNHHPSKHWSFQFGPQDPGVTVFTPRLGDLQGPWTWMEFQFSPGLTDLGWPEPALHRQTWTPLLFSLHPVSSAWFLLWTY